MLVGNDTKPEFSAQTLPPGSAPASRTFQPNNISEVPGQADNDATLRSHGKESTYTTAESTLGGATSGDVNTGLGKPMQGQSSSELRHDGQNSGQKQGLGLAGLQSGKYNTNQGVDERMDESQRSLESEHGARGTRGDKSELGAEDLPGESAETVARERD